jgi:hypothetical protein
VALVDALLDKITNESLRKALREQVDILLGKQAYGLVFQQHKPETVELHNHGVRRNRKVRIKSQENDALYIVDSVKKGVATIHSLVDEPGFWDIDATALVVVREFGDPIYARPAIGAMDKTYWCQRDGCEARRRLSRHGVEQPLLSKLTLPSRPSTAVGSFVVVREDVPKMGKLDIPGGGPRH